VNVWQTVLVFAVIPLGALGLFALLALGASPGRPARYRPGRPWEHDPVWYVPRPEAADSVASPAGRAAITQAARRRRLPAGGSVPAAVLDVPAPTARGGGNGQW
jgi:hypothetical protein